VSSAAQSAAQSAAFQKIVQPLQPFLQPCTPHSLRGFFFVLNFAAWMAIQSKINN
jgi:hypothetical protein